MPTYDGLFRPGLSPDGRCYAYDLYEERGNGVHALDVDGNTASFYPSWSPDARYMAVYTCGNPVPR
ncbi:MAG: hypothetical protein ACM3X4_00485 [Ignavibacteriales bacterium]